jgi:ribosomal protein S13
MSFSPVSQHALTHFYGIGHHTAGRICARLQIHDTCRVRQLSPTQITSIAAFLSSPATSPIPPRAPLASATFQPAPRSTPLAEPARRTRIPRAARRTTSAAPASQDQGCGPAALAADRSGLEARDAGEYCSPTDDRKLRWQEAFDGSACTRAKHADECKNGKEAQQSRPP